MWVCFRVCYGSVGTVNHVFMSRIQSIQPKIRGFVYSWRVPLLFFPKGFLHFFYFYLAPFLFSYAFTSLFFPFKPFSFFIIIFFSTLCTSPRGFHFFFRGRLLNINLWLFQFSLRFLFFCFTSVFLPVKFCSFLIPPHYLDFQLNLLF